MSSDKHDASFDIKMDELGTKTWSVELVVCFIFKVAIKAAFDVSISSTMHVISCKIFIRC